ncbi:MAG: Gfo/Idh/MocA family oxidoreductase [Bacteroidales bacterium]|nr:Gfo/Idh/MocA family oxidoreductase [Bacteroidales bacterium]
MKNKKTSNQNNPAGSPYETGKSEKDGISRRKFIASTAVAAGAFTIVPKHVLGFGQPAPSDKIVMAHIGCGIQGFAELPPLLTSPDIQIVAVCDPETDSRNHLSLGGPQDTFTSTRQADNIRSLLNNPKWREGIQYVPGGRMVMKDVAETFYAQQRAAERFSGVNAYADFRELLEKEDIDAVKIMTPDHLHATIAIHAMKKGKHVITHKPLANRLYESDLVIKTARETGVASYFMPYNSYDDLSLIKTWIDDGAIGSLREIHEWSNRPSWQQFFEIPAERLPIPAGFDWDLWLGPSLDRPYHWCYTHSLFRGWYEFGGGSYADMGHYSMWAVCDTFDLDNPAYAEGFGSFGTGTRNFSTGKIRENDYSFPHSATMRVHFNAKSSRGPVDVIWYDGGMKPGFIPELDEDNRSLPASGMMFVGDKGKILQGRIIPESKMQAYKGPQPPEPEERTANAPQQSGTPGGYTIRPLPPGFDQFIAACRGGSKNTPGNFISAGHLSTMINLAIVGLRTGARVDFDPVNRQITNLPESNKYLTREYRKGWEL